MSIKAENQLAAAATVLAVLGMLAAIQFSAAPPVSMKQRGTNADVGWYQTRPWHNPADSRLIEYQ